MKIQSRTIAVTQPRRVEITSVFSGRFDLAQIHWLRPVIASRWPLFLARSITLAGLVFTILAGLIGTPVGGQNFAIIFVWIAWWTALKLLFIPLGGKSWCSICPLPMPGEWLRQGGLVSKGPGRIGLGFRWPKRLRGYWLQTGLFLTIGLFSAVTLTDARLTALILAGLLALGIGLSFLFEKRAFCKYVCPIGGFSSLYAQLAPFEVRVRNLDLCTSHAEKTCYQECPWGLYPVALRDSSQCGLCMECLRVCPRDNIALNLRRFGGDLHDLQPTNRIDEAALGLVMLGSALSFTAVFSGPWGSLKMAAFRIGSAEWLAYAGAFLAFNLFLLPAVFTLSAWLSRQGQADQRSLRHVVAGHARALLPLGLFSWMAFTVSFALPKFSYILEVISDPMGWGWNLFGTADYHLSADFATASPVIQVALLLIGLTWSVNLHFRSMGAAPPRGRIHPSSAPGVLFGLGYTLLQTWLLIG